MADSDCAGPAPSLAHLEKREPPRLSLVVLPFANIGGDPEQDYIVDDVTESLTTDLSCISGAFVIARNTAFAYKGKAGDVKQIGRELNVRYVLEGSVQRSGNRMRVNVQLVDAETGSHIWAERFDKPVTDLFDMQDEIVSRLANRLGQELARAEAARAGRSANPGSMDHYFLGLAQFNKGTTAEFLDKARSHFDRALELDPDNVDALVGRARVDLALVSNYLSEYRPRRLRSAETDLGKALKLRPDNAIARNLAVAYPPGSALRSVLSAALTKPRAMSLEALRISPRDTYAGVWMLFAANAKLGLGRDEEAVAWLNRAVELSPMSPMAQFNLAAALARLGRIEDAGEAARAGLELNPSFTISRYRSSPHSDNPVYLLPRANA